MIYRVVNEERLEQVRDLWDYCFEKKDTPFFKYYFNEYCLKDNMVIGAFEKADNGEKLRSMVHINPYMVRIRNQEQLVPYLVGVATAPEARGQHLFQPLLETAFEVLRSQNIDFVTLMPIFAGIYLPYEFSYCYYRHEYKIPLSALKFNDNNDGLKVERVSLTEDILSPLYKKLTANYNGVPVRTSFQWHKLLTVHQKENVQCAVAYDNEQALGYMFYYIADDCFHIVELLAANQKVRNRLLQYVAMHQSSASKLHWLAEDWDKTFLNFANQSYSGSTAPFMMARCLDARKALAKLQVSENLPCDSLVLLLTDNIIERNSHLLKVKTAPGTLEAVSTIDQEDIVMDMGAFTQLYMGTFSASELYEAGKIKAFDESKLALLDKIFPKCRNYINEYF